MNGIKVRTVHCGATKGEEQSLRMVANEEGYVCHIGNIGQHTTSIHIGVLCISFSLNYIFIDKRNDDFRCDDRIL